MENKINLDTLEMEHTQYQEYNQLRRITNDLFNYLYDYEGNLTSYQEKCIKRAMRALVTCILDMDEITKLH